ncbi:AAA family ATPase [Variovorax sp. UC122_21]|uniref:AAA family ATPase n=1 Tax=Variovorax sp. UC122_21 TaxID=3374554 RepID=UPI00375830DB
MVAEVTHHALPNEPLRVAGFVAPPLSLTQLMGRDTDVDKALAALADRRLVSVVGSGGIGKSRLALRVTEVYRTRDANRPRSVAFADLAPLVSGDHVFSTLARSLGVPIEEADTFRLLQSRIAGTHLLLLIDNCEHVLEALAPLVMRLLVALPGLRILATSREALQVEGNSFFGCRL